MSKKYRLRDDVRLHVFSDDKAYIGNDAFHYPLNCNPKSIVATLATEEILSPVGFIEAETDMRENGCVYNRQFHDGPIGAVEFSVKNGFLMEGIEPSTLNPAVALASKWYRIND